MKKKIWIITMAAVLLLVLLIPIPTGVMKDGGTRSYTALTYKIIDWNRISGDGVYQKTRVYFGKNYFKSIDELWELEGVKEDFAPEGDYRYTTYGGTWLDKATAEKKDNYGFDYGIQKVNTNYNFDSTSKDLLEKNVLKNCICNREQAHKKSGGCKDTEKRCRLIDSDEYLGIAFVIDKHKNRL